LPPVPTGRRTSTRTGALASRHRAPPPRLTLEPPPTTGAAPTELLPPTPGPFQTAKSPPSPSTSSRARSPSVACPPEHHPERRSSASTDSKSPDPNPSPVYLPEPTIPLGRRPPETPKPSETWRPGADEGPENIPVPDRRTPCLTAREPRSTLPLDEEGRLKSLKPDDRVTKSGLRLDIVAFRSRRLWMTAKMSMRSGRNCPCCHSRFGHVLAPCNTRSTWMALPLMR
jgi:hypothetical protein